MPVEQRHRPRLKLERVSPGPNAIDTGLEFPDFRVHVSPGSNVSATPFGTDRRVPSRTSLHRLRFGVQGVRAVRTTLGRPD